MSDPRIRPARPEDVASVVPLVHRLAAYEGAADRCRLTVDQLRRRLFCADPAVFAHVAEHDGEVAGVAIWFLSFSTWDGAHGVYVEDLFVADEHRGLGLGRGLLTALARRCVDRGYSRLSWQVSDWNDPSIGFYDSLGAAREKSHFDCRLSGDALAALGG